MIARIVLGSLLAASAAFGATAADLAAPQTPDFLPDGLALRAEIPALAAQKLWTDYATPAEIAAFDSPATVWPVIPASRYDLSGFDRSALGSAVPAPGIHPRLLFSPEDVPALARRLASTVEGRKGRLDNARILRATLWNPASDEGRLFAKLASGDTADLRWPAGEGEFASNPLISSFLGCTHSFEGYQKQLGSTVHAGYLPSLLSIAAFECLLDADAVRGRQVAAALAEYYRLREPLIDRLNEDYHARRLAPRDVWRPMHWMVSAANLAWAYDCSASWMTPAERTIMTRVISKATSGKRSYGADAPTRWRDTNWVAWDLEHLLTALVIEGQPGSDPEVLRVGRETLQAFLDWGINEHGVIFETNGKNGAGLETALRSLTALARRGDNLFGHPHLRALTAAQAQCVVPSADLNVSNGTWGNAPFSRYAAATLATFFPRDAAADWLQRVATPTQNDFDPAAYSAKLSGPDAPRLKSINALDFFQASAVLGIRDWTGARAADGALLPLSERSALGLQPTFVDPVHGLLTARSGPSADALFLMFEARPDLRGVGHQHHDAGHFYLTALGLPWAVESAPKNSYSLDHNVVTIDGAGLADVAFAPRVNILLATQSPSAAFASADLKNAYDHGWITPMHSFWRDPAHIDGTRALTPDLDPELVAYYKGTRHVKTRLWGGNYFTENWGPVLKVAGNPVRTAFRSAGLVRGPRPYAVIIDDRRKDDQSRLYEWLMQLPDSVRIANLPTPAGPGVVPSVLLTHAPSVPGWNREASEKLPAGTPLLLVALLDASAAPSANRGNQLDFVSLPISLRQLAAPPRTGAKSTSTRLVIEQRAVAARFRVVLLPIRAGEPVPRITWDAASLTATVDNGKQPADTLVFSVGPDDRTRLTVTRDGSILAELR